jgi:hypothetical protein
VNLPFHVLPDGTQVPTIHLLYQAPAGTTQVEGEPLVDSGPTVARLACSPLIEDLSLCYGREAPMLRTDDPRAVTCPNCKDTKEYQKKVVDYARGGIIV